MKISKGQRASLLNLDTSIERDTKEVPESKGADSTRLVPSSLPVGEVRSVTLPGGEEALVIGAGLGRYRKGARGLPVVIAPKDWEQLQRWSYTRLLISGGQVKASDGSRSRPLVARFLTNTTYSSNVTIRYRNGNAFDLRKCNIAVVPNGLILGAERIKTEPQVGSTNVLLRDGRTRTKRKQQCPNALERLEALLRIR